MKWEKCQEIGHQRNVFENVLEDILHDVSVTGKKRPWREKKVANELLASVYESLGIQTDREEFSAKAARLRECATWMEFSVEEDGKKRLNKTFFCRVRLCPMCMWRRSLKVYDHTRRIMEGMKSEKEYGYISLVLTVKNCRKEELSAEIDRLMEAWNRFTKYKIFEDVVKGWYRGMEVTHNVNINSDSYDTFHPHFHCLLAVNKNYFSGRKYITHERWRELWKKARRLDYLPQVDVERVKGDTAKAVAEMAKYAAKEEEYIIPDDWDLTAETVKILDYALANRRFVAYGGKFKIWHKKLNLDDETDGDLIHIEDDKLSEDKLKLIYYTWHTGYNQYIKE